MTDFSLTNHRSLYLLQPNTSQAEDHATLHIITTETQFFGPAIVVETRYAPQLTEQLLLDGFSVELDGRELTLK